MSLIHALAATPAPADVSTIVGDVTTIVTGGVTWISSFVGAITSNPLILMFVVVSFVGLGVGLIRRLIRL